MQNKHQVQNLHQMQNQQEEQNQTQTQNKNQMQNQTQMQNQNEINCKLTLARDPQTGVVNEIRLGIKWIFVSKDLRDAGGSIFVGRSIVINH